MKTLGKTLGLCLLLASPTLAFADVTYDLSSGLRTGSTNTAVLSASGTGGVAIMYLWLGSGDSPVGVPEVDGDPMTFLGSIIQSGTGQKIYGYCFVNPPTSAVNYTSVTGSTHTQLVELLQGADQTCAVATTTAQATPTITHNHTVITDGAWIVEGARGVGTGETTAGAGAYERISTSGAQLYDSNAQLASGARSLTVSEDDAGSAVFGMSALIEPSADEEEPTASSTDAVGYQDWLFVNAVIIGLLGFLGIGVVMNPLK